MHTESLADFVAQGWERHAEQAADVAAGLAARASRLDGDAGGAVGLAEHVWLSHLKDPAGLEAFLQSLPSAVTDGESSGAPVRRARWVLATLAGQAAPEIPDAARWRAMQNLWSVWVERGQVAPVRAQLEAEYPRARAHADPAARKALAASTYGLALELREGRRGDADRDALMLALAEASRELWATAGDWLNVERGHYEQARCHAVLGQGAPALQHARACLSIIEQNTGDARADAFETFFAHEALAWAHRAAGDTAGLAAQRSRMAQLQAQVNDSSLKPWCEAAAAALDRAG